MIKKKQPVKVMSVWENPDNIQRLEGNIFKIFHCQLVIRNCFIFFEENMNNVIRTAFAAGIGWLINICSKDRGNFTCFRCMEYIIFR